MTCIKGMATQAQVFSPCPLLSPITRAKRPPAISQYLQLGSVTHRGPKGFAYSSPPPLARNTPLGFVNEFQHYGLREKEKTAKKSMHLYHFKDVFLGKKVQTTGCGLKRFLACPQIRNRPTTGVSQTRQAHQLSREERPSFCTTSWNVSSPSD